MNRLLDVAVAVVNLQHRALGCACDRAADALDDLAELLRWLAILTRAAP
jgi:hypothetical protein